MCVGFQVSSYRDDEPGELHFGLDVRSGKAY